VTEQASIVQELQARFPDVPFAVQDTCDRIDTLWLPADRVHDVLRYLKGEATRPFRMLYDLTAIDERVRAHRESQPPSDFSVVYHLLSHERNQDVRLKVALSGEAPSIRTVTGLWPSANWYERELWDMFGITVAGHPNLRRILLPPGWQGHPLRKDYPARATEMGPFLMPDEKAEAEQEALQFHPEEWGLKRTHDDTEFMFLNLGPQHPGTHGPFRIAVQLDGEEIIDAIPDIGFHHRGAEKMGERQSWHTYIPYTDRVDYLGGVMNNLAYCQAVETLCGIEVPERARMIRVMLAEFFRIISHLVWYGTFAQDLGAMSPVFYMFSDRERCLDLIEAITGARMHPSWFRIGGVAQDLPAGWDGMVEELVRYLPPRFDEYDRMVLDNRIFQGRTRGIGQFSLDEALEWGASGPMLRACGLPWDLRKMRPYGGYEQFDFEVPTGHSGDCYDRAVVHVQEMRQSVRIIAQCLGHMPRGPYKSTHPLATPPLKDRTMQDIETLIHHFLNVSWGPVVPAGEAMCSIEGTKGMYGYYLVSDQDVVSYRTRIRTASFPHLQMIPLMARGRMLSDLLSILGSIDFVLADVDR